MRQWFGWEGRGRDGEKWIHAYVGRKISPAGKLKTGAGGGERGRGPKCWLDLCLAWI